MQALQQHFPALPFGLYDKFACSKQRPINMPSPPPPSHASFKRSADAMESASPVKRLKLSDPSESLTLRTQQQPVAPKPSFTHEQQPSHSSSCTQNDPAQAPSAPGKPALERPEDPSRKDQPPREKGKVDSSKLDLARQKIEAQLNLEILLKHDELRLIEQELAKAQICMEQIRRCRLIPFPGQPGAEASVDNISDGVGAALQPAPGMHRPVHAPPWGVTDGPYSQHYARWLIPDPAFDPAPVSRPRNAGCNGSLDGRGLRAVVGDGLSGRRRHRPSVDVGTPMSPSSAPQPKIPGGPLLLTRADGVRVKLVCRHCSKEDINSVQGFLNHCRIAHGDSMKTHAEAAAMHGVPLEEGEFQQAATPPAVEQSPATPVAQTPVHTLPPRVHVHPLNAANRAMQPPSTPTTTTPAKPSPLSSSFSASSGFFPAVNYTARSPITATAPAKPAGKSRPMISKPVVSVPDPNFVASPQTPSLSALAQKRGISLDLAKLVTSAKQRLDIDKIETLVGDGDVDEIRPSAKSQPIARQVTGQSRAPAPAEPAPEPQMQEAEIVPFIPDSASSSFQRMLPSSSPGPESLSPRSAAHTAQTSETNPGMMTDREDDPDEDDFEVADSEDDRAAARRDVHVRGEDFPMTDVSALGEDKIHHHQADSVSEPLKPLDKKRGRPKKQK